MFLGLDFQKTKNEYSVFEPDQNKNDLRIVTPLLERDLSSIQILGDWVQSILRSLDSSPLEMKKGHFRWSGTPAGSLHFDDTAWTVAWAPVGKTLEVVLDDGTYTLKNNEIVFFRGGKVLHKGFPGNRLVYTFMFYPKDGRPAR